MRAYHATELNLAAKHCPRALDFYEARLPYPRDHFQVGICAHVVLQAVGEATNKAGRVLTDSEQRDAAQSVVIDLIANGRTYDKHPEPPPKPDDAFAGRDLALDYLAFNPLEPGAQYEVGLALDSKGSPVPYWSKDPEPRLRAILDRVRIFDEMDEESSRTVLEVADYKSAWSASESDLDTLQRKIQAVTAWKVYGEASGVDVLRLVVVNVRLQQSYPRDYWREDGLRDQIASWTRDILSTCAATDEQKRILGKRPAAPGAGCMGCPYIQACPDALDYIERRGLHRTPEKRATAYAVACAMKEELARELRDETDETPIKIHGGIVGYSVKEKREAIPDAHSELWDRWEFGGGDALGLLKALGLTTGNIAKAARVLHYDRKEKQDREKLIEELTQPVNAREFGVTAVGTEEPEPS